MDMLHIATCRCTCMHVHMHARAHAESALYNVHMAAGAAAARAPWFSDSAHVSCASRALRVYKKNPRSHRSQ